MPSLRTRQAYDRHVLATAEVALSEAASAVSAATDTLETVQGNITDLTSGDLELDAVNVGGVRLIWNGSEFEVEP
jgi:hypothetical protein